MSLINDTLHFPDISFVRFCQEQYGVNKGIYNTIDLWFYERGFSNIVNRRQAILEFLQFAACKKSEGKIRIKFGSHGLTAILNDFLLSLRKNA